MSAVYLVVRRAIQEDGQGCYGTYHGPTESRVPLRLFASRKAAEQLVTDLTAAARRTMNPFHLNGHEVPNAVRSYLAELSLSTKCPKDASPERWRGWWDRCADEMTGAQLAAAWAAFGSLQPYEVIKIECE